MSGAHRMSRTARDGIYCTMASGVLVEYRVAGRHVVETVPRLAVPPDRAPATHRRSV